MNSEGFNTECLITEVQKRPGLYNTELPEYKDRKLKLASWKQVCEKVVRNWKDLNASERREQSKIHIFLTNFKNKTNFHPID